MTGTTLHIPTLETQRLTLRAPRWSDFDAYAEFRGDAARTEFRDDVVDVGPQCCRRSARFKCRHDARTFSFSGSRFERYDRSATFGQCCPAHHVNGATRSGPLATPEHIGTDLAEEVDFHRRVD